MTLELIKWNVHRLSSLVRLDLLIGLSKGGVERVTFNTGMNNSFDVKQYFGCCKKVNTRCARVCVRACSECMCVRALFAGSKQTVVVFPRAVHSSTRWAACHSWEEGMEMVCLHCLGAHALCVCM